MIVVTKYSFDELTRLGIANPSNIRTDLYVLLSLVITVFAAGVFYKKYRWRIVDDPSLFCIQCSYDLTGNESGVCPECGTEIKA